MPPGRVRHLPEHTGMKPGLKSGINFLAALLREKRCSFCTAPIPPGARGLIFRQDTPVDCHKLGVCPDCLARLPRRGAGYCPRCGEFMGQEHMPAETCPQCLRQPPPWRKLYFYGAYHGYLRDLLLRAKFSEGLHQADGLGRLLALHPELAGDGALFHPPSLSGRQQPGDRCRCGESGGPETACAPPVYSCIVPVPLHNNRLRERGYNQAAQLAGPLAGKMRLRLTPGLLRRTVDTRHQTGLPRERRRNNVAGAFQATPGAKGLSILLFDDVMTTGSTLAAAAACLLQAGAAVVDVAVVARTAARNMTNQAF